MNNTQLNAKLIADDAEDALDLFIDRRGSKGSTSADISALITALLLLNGDAIDFDQPAGHSVSSQYILQTAMLDFHRGQPAPSISDIEEA